MRTSRYLWSEAFSPWMIGVAALAPWVQAMRQKASDDNPFVVAERDANHQIVTAFEGY